VFRRRSIPRQPIWAAHESGKVAPDAQRGKRQPVSVMGLMYSPRPNCGLANLERVGLTAELI
jgi:hypothetical protein